MTARALVPFVVLAACRTAAVCDEPTCQADCKAREAALAAQVPEGGELLTFDEVQALGPLVDQIRMGLRVPADSFMICHGVTECEAPAERTMRQPPGDYVVVAKARVPTVGVWTLKYEKVCYDGNDEVSRGGGPIPLQGREDGEPVDLGVLDHVKVLAIPASRRNEVVCAYRLSSDEEPTFALELKILLPRPG